MSATPQVITPAVVAERARTRQFLRSRFGGHETILDAELPPLVATVPDVAPEPAPQEVTK